MWRGWRSVRENIENQRKSIEVNSSQVKDVRVPEQLMRAMAAEAEAAREARAKVNLLVMMMMFMMREARAKVTEIDLCQ